MNRATGTPLADMTVNELRATVERLSDDADADDRLLEIMREHAAALGVKYDGDQEYLVAVKAEILRLRAELDKAWRAAADQGAETTRLTELIFHQTNILRDACRPPISVP